MTLNIRNLCKLIETLSKLNWTRVKERLDDVMLDQNGVESNEKLAIE